MATNSKVFVSPGVYTSEVDLSFVAQSVGVTTLGIAGETLKGPAFEPIFIRNFDEFTTYFGGTSPEKFVNTQIPKYEAAYIAKAYLQQSNQLFVTRILGLSGYDAGPSWSVVTVANVDPTTVGFDCASGVTVDCVFECTSANTIDFTVPFSGCNSTDGTVNFLSDFPTVIQSMLTESYQQFDGGTSSLDADITSTIFSIISLDDPTTGQTVIDYFGSIDPDDYSGFTNPTFSAGTQNNRFDVPSVDLSQTDLTSPLNDSWYYALFDNTGNGNYTGFSFYSYVTGVTATTTTSNCASFYSFSVGGSITSFDTISSGGTGYTATTSLSTTTISGVGAGLTVDIEVDGLGAVTAATINCEGTGYEVGDIVQINQPGSGGDAYLTIDAIGSTTDGIINYNTNTISVCLPSGTSACVLSSLVPTFSACTSGVSANSVTQSSGGTEIDFSSGSNTYTLTSEDGSITTTWTVNVYEFDPCVTCPGASGGSQNVGEFTTCYSGQVVGKVYLYTGNSFTDYDDLVVTTLRSRGVSNYTDGNNPTWEVTGITDVTLDMTGPYSGVSKNPYLPFVVNVTNYQGDLFSFETSMSISDAKYVTKVFGTSNFGKPRTTVPLMVEERFQSLLNYAYRKGYIRGLNSELISLDSAQSQSSTSIGWYLDRYQSPSSPWVVSEVRGSKVYNLFKFYTIADGNDANTSVKLSITDISFANQTFTVLVRDYFDTDSSPTVLEKFTNCSMNPSENSFIAKKIGTLDGEYELNSKYVMVEMNEDAPIDSLPCGFEGFNFREYSGARSPFPIFKTKYDFPGEVIYNPPFGLPTGGDNATTTGGDNIRRTYLGMSNFWGYDPDFFEYVGKRNPISTCDIEGGQWSYRTRGFHMDKNASGITIGSAFSTSGTPRFYVGDAPFASEPINETSPYYRLFSRKFTLFVQGGFDGWDIYRERRTNSDRYVLGKLGFLNGSCPTDRYPDAKGWGAFKQISIGDGTRTWANTDYYAYLLGIRTFSNPEAVNINVFVTPGIDYVNNSNLVEDAVEMIEFERADSLYITTTPDYDLLLPTTTGQDGLIYPTEAVDNLETTGIDSNYTCTYYPWVLTRDTVNNTQIYIPATAEVTRNLALTDNIAFPWFAAAGYTRGIVNSIKARKKLTQEDRDTLYVGRINPIATFSDVGTVIWGNKTLQVRESALDRINVRRLLLQARKLISAVSVRLLFDQNDEQVRQDFLNAVNPILDSIRRDRGLYDFRVTVSSDTADLDRNQLTGKIYVKPTRSLEFIDITFYITPTGASFENI
jgi:hypothetical protein